MSRVRVFLSLLLSCSIFPVIGDNCSCSRLIRSLPRYRLCCTFMFITSLKYNFIICYFPFIYISCAGIFMIMFNKSFIGGFSFYYVMRVPWGVRTVTRVCVFYPCQWYTSLSSGITALVAYLNIGYVVPLRLLLRQSIDFIICYFLFVY